MILLVVLSVIYILFAGAGHINYDITKAGFGDLPLVYTSEIMKTVVFLLNLFVVIMNIAFIFIDWRLFLFLFLTTLIFKNTFSTITTYCIIVPIYNFLDKTAKKHTTKNTYKDTYSAKEIIELSGDASMTIAENFINNNKLLKELGYNANDTKKYELMIYLYYGLSFINIEYVLSRYNYEQITKEIFSLEYLNFKKILEFMQYDKNTQSIILNEYVRSNGIFIDYFKSYNIEKSDIFYNPNAFIAQYILKSTGGDFNNTNAIDIINGCLTNSLNSFINKTIYIKINSLK